MPATPEPAAASRAPSVRDHRRFLAAIGLLLVWIAFLIGLAATDAHLPQERAGAVPAGR